MENKIVKQKAKIAVEKLVIYSGLITLGHSILTKDGNLFSGALFLEAISITSYFGSKQILNDLKQKKLSKKIWKLFTYYLHIIYMYIHKNTKVKNVENKQNYCITPINSL